MRLRTTCLTIVVACVSAFPVVADAKLSRAGTPAVSFTAVGVGGTKIVGNTADLSIDEDAQAVTISVPLGNLTTGIGLRDKHMKEKYLEVGKFPTATLKVDRASLKIPAAGAEATSEGSGTMTIHGVTKPVRFQYTAKRGGDAMHVSGGVHLNMNDYGIFVEKYLGVTVKPELDVSVTFDAKDG